MPLSSISKKTNIIPENMHVNQFSTAYNEPSKILSNMESVNNTSGSFSIAKIVDNVKHLPYPKIKQYLDVISNVSKNCGKHESLPTLNFHGTVKLHGTNGGVAYDYSTEKFWAQSRNQLLLEGTPDNQGFATYIYKDTLRPVLENIFNGIDKHRNDGEFRAVVYGEWCGKGIQKNVAISELPRNFFVFNIALFDGDNKCRWLNPADMHEIIVEARGGEWAENSPIFSIEDFPTWNIAIYFDNEASKEAAATKLEEITDKVEERCPVSKQFGKEGFGEGVVWQSEVPINGNSPILTGDFMFKVKGQKFSESNHMTRVPVRVEKVNSVKQFLDRVMTENRLFSVLSKLSSSENNVKIFCQKVKSDIRKEENLLIEESNLDMKVLAAEIDKRAGTWFREQNKASMP